MSGRLSRAPRLTTGCASGFNCWSGQTSTRSGSTSTSGPTPRRKMRSGRLSNGSNSFDPEKDVGASKDAKPEPFKRFDDDAQQLWIEWSTRLNNRTREGALSRAMTTHLAKYEKLVAALALIFHLVDCASVLDEQGASVVIGRNLPVNRAQLERAIKFSDYLETHAARVYSSGALGSVEAAKLIHNRITKGDLRAGFSARDIYRSNWSGLTDKDLVNEAVELLADSRLDKAAACR